MTDQAEQGFTLMEVLLALSILAMVAIPVIQTTGDNIRNTHHIKQKTIAQWIADNEMEKIYLHGNWPGLEWTALKQTQADQIWQIRKRSVKTASTDFRMIEVEVRQSNNKKQPPLVRLQSYMYNKDRGYAAGRTES